MPLSAASAIAVAFAVAMALALDVPKAAELAASTTPVCPTASEDPIAVAAACKQYEQTLDTSAIQSSSDSFASAYLGVVGSIVR